MNRIPMDPVDAAWWRMDTPTNRMTIVGLLEFDTAFSRQEFTDLLRERLAPFPRFRLRVVTQGGRPHWEEDPEFDFANQVVVLPGDAPEGEQALKRVVGSMMSSALPADRPPWQFVVVDAYNGGSAVIARLHHAIADGLALIHVLKSLADGGRVSTSLVGMPTAGTVDRAGTIGQHAQVEEEPDPADPEEGDTELDTAVQTRRFRLADLRQWLARLPGLMAALLKFAITGADKKTALRGKQGVDKSVDWSPNLDLRNLRRTAVEHSATINDLLLAALAGGLRRYLEAYRELAEDFELRAIVPINLRHRHEELGLGNRFGLVILALPVGLRNLRLRVQAIHHRMLEARNSMEPVAAFGLLSTLGRGPGFLENLAVKRLSATSSAAITNVPGPRSKLVLAGRTLQDLMFWVPRGGSVTMGISILTYAGRARIGLATDAGLVSDPAALSKSITEELTELGLA